LGNLIASSVPVLVELVREQTLWKLPVMVDLQGFNVIGSSEQVHVVDALAITGDEGRGSLR
jgi:hypothetical protein